MSTTYDEKISRKRVSKAKLALMLKGSSVVFFCALLAQMKLMITPQVKTAATNGTWIKFNPFFIETLTTPQLMGLIMHELLHTVFEHIGRCMDHKLDAKLFNIAGDHYINLYLLQHGFELPPGGYADPKYKKWSTMQIYYDLERNPPPDLKNYTMDVVPDPDPNETETSHKERITANITKAMVSAKMADAWGSIPQDLARKLEDTINPRLPWNVIFQNYMSHYTMDDFTWSRPNRRYTPQFYLPTQRSETIGQITFGVDTSASMRDRDLGAIHKEIRYVWETLKPETMRIMTFDTRVHLNRMFHEGDCIDKLELTGGGGTNVQPLLDSVEEERPMFAAIFTDGFFSQPNMDRVLCDIYWIIKGNRNFQAPKGSIIHYETR